MKIEIKSRWTSTVLWAGEAESLRAGVIAAVHGGANLYGADLYGAGLRGAYLDGVKINWQSHDLIAELLRRAAGTDPADRQVRQRRAFAGLVLISRDWCWDVWERMREWHRDEAGWALGVLATYVQDGDGAPEVLRETARAEVER